MAAADTFYDVIRRQGITRRSFTQFGSLTAASHGFGPRVATAMAEARRRPRNAFQSSGCTGSNAPAVGRFSSARLIRWSKTWSCR